MIEVFIAVDSASHSGDELRHLLNLMPDEAWDVGSIYRLGDKDKKHAFSRWAVLEHVKSIEEFESAVERIIRRIEPIEEKFRDLPSNVRVAFSVCLTERSSVFGLSLERHHVQFIAGIRAELDFSFVVAARG